MLINVSWSYFDTKYNIWLSWGLSTHTELELLVLRSYLLRAPRNFPVESGTSYVNGGTVRYTILGPLYGWINLALIPLDLYPGFWVRIFLSGLVSFCSPCYTKFSSKHEFSCLPEFLFQSGVSAPLEKPPKRVWFRDITCQFKWGVPRIVRDCIIKPGCDVVG
jgi:hypothetical protein